ncbi:MAG: cobaltochelatase subunit CobN [Candidatus Methanomethylophilaceae archaeon]|nr:cobaltochelatase subunit CobN [Candidatus Methanomethylophilaceae archaeon]
MEANMPGAVRAVFVMVRSFDPFIFENASKALADKGVAVEPYAIRSDHVDDDPLAYQELCERTAAADIVLVHCSGQTDSFHRFQRYRAVLESSHALVLVYSRMADVVLMHRDMFAGTDAEFKEVLQYLDNRGPENDVNMLLWFARKLGVTDMAPDPPIRIRTDGIYHPDFPRDVTWEDYIGSLDATRPSVGIAISSNYWIYDNLDHIDMIIRGLESRGMNAIPMFFAEAAFNKFRDRGTDILSEYFTRDGKVLIDALVTFGTSIVSHSRSAKGVRYSDDDNVFHTVLDVPVIQAMAIRGDYADYESDRRGLDKHDLRASSVGAELEGEVITVPVAYTPFGGAKKAIPIPDRIDHLCDTVKGWVNLRRKPPSERKIAILLWQSRPDSGVIGKAAGLDGGESIAALLRRLKEEGYTMGEPPSDGKELIDRFLSNVTNDLDNVSNETVREKAADLVPLERYLEFYWNIPEWDRGMIEEAWGKPKDDLTPGFDSFVIPGIVDGNVYIGFQPLRGAAEKMEQNIHDPFLFTPHRYICFYHWLKYIFKADAIVHTGTHGTLEWLPGKNMGLSQKCNPDLVVSSIPIIYPFVVDDPGEGIQPKRRTESVIIGHMPPTLTRAGSYDSIDEVSVTIQDYLRLRHSCSDEQRSVMVEQIYNAAKRNNFLNDLGLENRDPGPDGFEPYIVELHEIIDGLKDSLIPTDLHVLGRVPEGRHMDESVYSIMRYDNGAVPSLRDSFVSNAGYDVDDLLADPSGKVESGMLKSEVLEKLETELMDLIAFMRENDYDVEMTVSRITETYGRAEPALKQSIQYVAGTLVPNLRRMSEELDNTLDGLAGRYVLPGPSGVPARGGADILPMGRNYYSLDPATLPKRAAWEIGRRMADQMIERFKEGKGTYPREIGFIIWATDTIKTGGDDLSYILWLMGVKPVWSGTDGEVVGLEVIPLEELGRPRVDVTINITGMFRDAFPMLIDMIDDAFHMVAELDEDDESNAIAANYRSDVARMISEGIAEDEARKRSSLRMFGAPPGGYGTGVNVAVATGAWSTVKDLADVYMDWCSNAYSKGSYGIPMREEFVRRFSSVEATVKNTPDRDYDVFNCDDYYEFLGGMNAFVRAYGNKEFVSMMGDSSDTKRTKVRHTQDEIRHVFRSKIMNPKYLEGLKEHGYRGAMELASNTELLLGWGATSDFAEDWMYGEIADRFVFDDATREWMDDVNPYALMSMVKRLLEAEDRGLWNAPDDVLDRLKEIFMDVEEHIEDITDR